MFYEVFIPARPEDGFDTTITVEADNWMSALKSGLERTGQGSDIRNVMCDIKTDNTIHVTDATTRRVFVLKEVEAVDVQKQSEKTDLNQNAPPAGKSDPTPSTHKPENLKPAPFERESTQPLTPAIQESEKPTAPLAPVSLPGKTEPIYEQAPQAPPKNETIQTPPPGTVKPPAQPPAQKPVEKPPSAKQQPPIQKPQAPIQKPQPEKLTPQTPPPQKPPVPAQPAPPVQTKPPEPQGLGGEQSWTSEDGRISIGSATYEALRRDEAPAKVLRETRAPSGTRPAVQMPSEEDEAISQNVIEEVFLEIQRIHEGMEMEDVIAYAMDLSLKKIHAEAGSIMFADLTGTELYFATARGPKAKQIMDLRVPMGAGIVGFCVREGVSLSISDAEKDPRFYREISEALGYATKNLCCAPVQHEGRVYGAIELLNKSRPFLPNEVSALTYIASQLAKYIHDQIMAKEKI